MLSEQLLNCAVASWYPSFVSVSVKTKLIRLPQELMTALVSGGVHLPGGSPAVSLSFCEPAVSGFASTAFRLMLLYSLYNKLRTRVSYQIGARTLMRLVPLQILPW